MTVNLWMHNGLFAVAATDAQVTYFGNRHANSWQKMETFTASDGHGVIYGAGNGVLTEAALHEARTHQEGSIEDLVNKVNGEYQLAVEHHMNGVEQSNRRRAERELQSLPKEASKELREQLIREHANNSREVLKQEEPGQASIIAFAAYNKAENRIVTYVVTDHGPKPSHIYQFASGSGQDGANAYFVQRLHGLTPREMKDKEVLFHALNAQTQSNMNVGVGGTPSISIITPQEVTPLDYEIRVGLMNVSGAYVGEWNQRQLTRKQTPELLFRISQGDAQAIKTAAKAVGMSTTQLVSDPRPPDKWQEMANRKWR